MEISLKTGYGFEVIIVADNVRITEDIEKRTYKKDADGKVDFKTPPHRDIDEAAINQFTNFLSDLVYYRKEEFDSSVLIEQLFEKLPEQTAIDLAKKLQEKYQ